MQSYASQAKGWPARHLAPQPRTQNANQQQATVQRKPKNPPGTKVYVASAGTGNSGQLKQLAERVRILFGSFCIELPEQALEIRSEDSGYALLLDWNTDLWGAAPSRWMDYQALNQHLLQRFSEQSYLLATQPWSEEIPMKALSTLEQQWIREVLATEELSFLFRVADDLPKVVVHRVAQFDKKTVQGRTRGHEVAIADASYADITTVPDGRGGKRGLTEEETFKETLVHELVHFLEGQVAAESNYLREMLHIMHSPEDYGFVPFAFGWFEHPDSEAMLHFDLHEVMGFHPQLSILGHDALLQVRKSGAYEHSPMPMSGDTISSEEDLARTFGLFFASAATRKELANTFPLRHGLVVAVLKLIKQRLLSAG